MDDSDCARRHYSEPTYGVGLAGARPGHNREMAVMQDEECRFFCVSESVAAVLDQAPQRRTKLRHGDDVRRPDLREFWITRASEQEKRGGNQLSIQHARDYAQTRMTLSRFAQQKVIIAA